MHFWRTFVAVIVHVWFVTSDILHVDVFCKYLSPPELCRHHGQHPDVLAGVCVFMCACVCVSNSECASVL